MANQLERRLPRAYRDLPPTPVVAKTCTQYVEAAKQAALEAGTATYNSIDIKILEDMLRLFAKCQIRDAWVEHLKESEK